MKPIIALNLKVYKESLGERGLKLCRIASEVSLLTGVRIIVAPQAVDLVAASKFHEDVYAQHVDGNEAGAFTGTITPEALVAAGCKGSLINHSEHRIPFEKIAAALLRMNKLKLEGMLCTTDARESADYAKRLGKNLPAFISVEPPELIGSGISVSNAKPEVVVDTVKMVKDVANIPVLCGAGVSNAADVKKAIELGADGVLLASAYVKAKDPKKLLSEMASILA
jgi:triosephosphate isomerase